MSDLIKKLKDPKLAQPFGIYEKYYPEKAEVLKKAGKENCFVLCGSNNWEESNFGFRETATYILKPDYQPQPEYVNLLIVRGSDWYGAESRPDFILPLQFVPLNCLESLPGFEEFWYSDEGAHISTYRQDIVKFIEVKHEKVYARFRKE